MKRYAAALALVLVVVMAVGAVAYAGTGVKRIPTGEKVCALTFDDAATYSPQLLQILQQYGVTATFFTTGQWIDAAPDQARAIIAAGCDIGCHSYSHPKMWTLANKKKMAQFVYQLTAFDAACERAGIPHAQPLFRAPFGGTNKTMLQTLAAYGYVNVLWSDSSGDGAARPKAANMVKAVLRQLKPGAIILMHASKPQSVQALPAIIQGIQARGYRIVDLQTALGYGPNIPVTTTTASTTTTLPPVVEETTTTL